MKYKNRYYYEISLFFTCLSLVVALVMLTVSIAVALVFFIISIFYLYGFIIKKYTKVTHQVIEKGLKINRKLITEIEVINNFANCVEYDVIKRKGIFELFFKSTIVKFIIKKKVGIQGYETEYTSICLMDKDVENYINEVKGCLDSIIVKI